MEIRRFGPGHRRPDGPPGTTGLTGQVIHSDERGVIAELAFSRRGVIVPHSNPNLTFFIVISGGGFVQVGDERARINHGEAVVWPPDVVHGAYTEGTEMRAIVVELIAPRVTGLLDGQAAEIAKDRAEPARGSLDRAETARGSLAQSDPTRADYDSGQGEPW